MIIMIIMIIIIITMKVAMGVDGEQDPEQSCQVGMGPRCHHDDGDGHDNDDDDDGDHDDDHQKGGDWGQNICVPAQSPRSRS